MLGRLSNSILRARVLVAAGTLVVTALAVAVPSSASSPSPLTLTGEQPYFSFASQALSDRMGLAVNVASGNLLVQGNDVRIAGTGIDLSVARFYNSQSGQSTDFGGFWTMASGADVHVAYNTPTSGDATFYGPSGYVKVLTPNGSGGFNAPDGLDASLTHNSDGTSTLKFDRNGETYTFNSAGALQSDADRNNNKVTYNYSSGHLSTIVDTRNRTLTVTSNSAGQITKLQDSSGRTWTYCYNSAGDLTQSTDPNGKSTYYGYTGSHLLSKITDPNGNVSQIAYGSNGQVSSISRAPASSGGAQETTKFAYSLSPSSPCPSGAYGETTVTDPNGHNTIYCYDGSGRTTLTQNADGNNNSRSWGQDDLPSTVTTPDQAAAGSGVNTSLTYDNSTHAITGVTEGTGANSSISKKITYDPSSPNPYRNFFPATITDTQGHTTTYNYDNVGNLTSVKNALGSKNNLSYNSHGQVIGVTDANGHSRSYGYDSVSQLTTLTPPQPSSLGTTTIGYDGLSRITSVTDGKGQKRTYCYDNLDRVTQITYADGSKETYSYDADGNLLTQTDTSSSGAAQTTTFTWDAINRPTGASYPTGNTVSYGFDAANNLTSFADGGGTVSYSYDPANLLTQLTDAVGTTKFGHSPGGARTSTTFPSGASESFSLDAADRMTGISVKGTTGSVLTSQGYSYKNAGGSDTALLQSASDSAGNQYGYSYDAANQLTRASITNAGNMTDDYQYTYDSAGNHTSQTTKYNGGAYTTQTLAYNAANQLCWSVVGSSSNGCSSAPSGANVFSFDGNGNELGSSYGGGFKLTWNAKDQMASEQDSPSATVITYAYLGSGQGDRVQEGGSSFENSLLGLSARTYSGTTTTFTRDPQGVVIDDHQGTGNGQWFVYDRQGNVIGLVNSSGSLHRTFKYEAPGGVIQDSGSGSDTAIRYHGAWNGAGNMYHFGQRDYDPTLREWTQPDPIDQPTDLTQANGYAYAGNDPINNADPTGRSILGDVADVVGGVAAAAGGIIGQAACTAATDGLGAAHCAVATLPIIQLGVGVAGYGVYKLVHGG